MDRGLQDDIGRLNGRLDGLELDSFASDSSHTEEELSLSSTEESESTSEGSSTEETTDCSSEESELEIEDCTFREMLEEAQSFLEEYGLVDSRRSDGLEDILGFEIELNTETASLPVIKAELEWIDGQLDAAEEKLYFAVDKLGAVLAAHDIICSEANALPDSLQEYEELDINDYRDLRSFDDRDIAEVCGTTNLVREELDAIASANPSLKRKREEEEAIRVEQERTDLVFSRADFGALIFELLRDEDASFTSRAVEALQTAAEAYIVDVIDDAAHCAYNLADREIEPRDIRCAAVRQASGNKRHRSEPLRS